MLKDFAAYENVTGTDFKYFCPTVSAKEISVNFSTKEGKNDYLICV